MLRDHAASAVRTTIDAYVVAVDVSRDVANGTVGASLDVVAALGYVALRAFRRTIASGMVATRIASTTCVAAVAGLIAAFAALVSATVAGLVPTFAAGVAAAITRLIAAAIARSGIATVVARSGITTVVAGLCAGMITSACTAAVVTRCAAMIARLSLGATRVAAGPAILTLCAPSRSTILRTCSARVTAAAAWMCTTTATWMGSRRVRSSSATAAMRPTTTARRFATCQSDCGSEENNQCHRPDREKTLFLET